MSSILKDSMYHFKCNDMSDTKDFRYTIRTKDGKLLAQRIVGFGSKNDPFPDDWIADGRAQIALHDYKQKMFESLFDIAVEESSELTKEAMAELKDESKT